MISLFLVWLHNNSYSNLLIVFKRLHSNIQISKLRKRRSKRGSKKSSKRKHFSRQAYAILKFLSAGCYSEAEIRGNLGDNPDTSKALRM